MKTDHGSKQSGPWSAGPSLALVVVLLALSLVLVAGLAHAQSGSISGAVTYYGGLSGPHNITVCVSQHPEAGHPDEVCVAAGPGGEYTAPGLADDAYYVSASLDAGGAGSSDCGPEPCGFYDPDGDNEPDLVIVAGGEAASGIDIALGGPWLPLHGPSGPGGQAIALAVHPSLPGTAYAALAPVGAYDSGPSVIYKTEDGAASWTPVYTAEHQVYTLAATGTRVYAGALNPAGQGASIYLSQDSGLNWTPVYSFTMRGAWLDLAIHPTDPAVAVIGGWAQHRVGGFKEQSGLVYRTEDGGLTWTPVLTKTYPDGEGQITAVLVHPFTPTLVLAAGNQVGSASGALYRSEDGGQTWPGVSTVPGAQFMSLLAHVAEPQVLYAATTPTRFTRGASRVFRSADAGLSWGEMYGEGGGWLAFEPSNTVYALASSGRLSSSASDGDAGTWDDLDQLPGALALAIDVGVAPPALYAGSPGDGVLKSTDGGANWEWRNQGITSLSSPRDLDVDPEDGNRIFAAGGCSGGWLTTDGGGTWQVPGGLADCMGAFAISPLDPAIVYGGAHDCSRGAVLRSEDGGLEFAPVYTATFVLKDCSGGGQNIQALAVAPSRPGTVYAAGSNKPSGAPPQAMILRSLDDGASWSTVLTLPDWSSLGTLAMSPADDDVVYAGGEGCGGDLCGGLLYRTADGGDSWDLALVTSDTIASIAVDPWNPEVVYAGSDDYRVRKSGDGGDTWSVVREPPWLGGGVSGNLLAIDPYLPSHVYLAGWGFVGETMNGGQTWSGAQDPIEQGTPGGEPQSLVVDNGTEIQSIYASFGGVWAYRRLAPQPLRVYLPLVVRSCGSCGPQYPWSGQIVDTFPNCTLTRLFGFVLDRDGGLAGDVWLHVWADGWDGTWARSQWTAFGTDTPWQGDEGNWDAVLDNIPRDAVWHACVVMGEGQEACVSNVVDAVTTSDCQTGQQVVVIHFRRN